MIRFFLLAFAICFPIVILIKYIYYKHTKYGKAEWNKMKHEEQEFLNKWGDK